MAATPYLAAGAGRPARLGARASRRRARASTGRSRTRRAPTRSRRRSSCAATAASGASCATCSPTRRSTGSASSRTPTSRCAARQGLPVSRRRARPGCSCRSRARLVVLALGDKTAILRASSPAARCEGDVRRAQRAPRLGGLEDDALVAAEAVRTKGRLPRPLILARAVDDAHRSRLQADPLGVLAMVPRLPRTRRSSRCPSPAPRCMRSA